MHISVIGAGASGILAALHAAWTGAQVTLIEGNPAIGRKLLVTGSGRCNITNANAAASAYTCADPAWLEALFARFGVSDLISTLQRVGIPVRPTHDGWYYPLSESAHTVVNALKAALTAAGVVTRLNTRVKSIASEGSGLKLTLVEDEQRQNMSAERVILAAGGKAYPNLGSRGDLFPQLERMGHTVLPLRPALAPILADLGGFRGLQGMRFDAGLTLQSGSQVVGKTAGNLIVTQVGFNGPAVMDLSHLVSANPTAKMTLSLDLLHYVRVEFETLLANLRLSSQPVSVFLGAFMAPKVATVYLQNLHIREDAPLSSLPDAVITSLTASLSGTRFNVTGTGSFDQSQVTAGGVPVNEVNAATMESLRVSGLYLCGETLDVVGPCGGYNLQYAFSSGAVAGMAAAA